MRNSQMAKPARTSSEITAKKKTALRIDDLEGR